MLTLRRVFKVLLFGFQDELRLKWAVIVEEVLAVGRVPEDLKPIRYPWNRAALEATLLARRRTATGDERYLLGSLFRVWGLSEHHRAQLKARSPWKQAWSALLLARMGCEEASPDLISLLGRAKGDARTAAVHALALLGQPTSIPTLIELVADPGTRHMRPVLSALVRCAENTPGDLTRFLSHGSPTTCRIAASALAEVASPRELPALLTAAELADPEIRAKVATALGHTRDQLAFMALDRLAHDATWYVRLRAIGALPGIPSTGVETLLLGACKDTDWRVRSKAVTALHKLVGGPLYLIDQLRCMQDRYVVDTLISTLEHDGAIWDAINAVTSPNLVKRDGARMLIKKLVAIRPLKSVTWAVKWHSEPEVRQALKDLGLEVTNGRASRFSLWQP